jgi:hypothetical protein
MLGFVFLTMSIVGCRGSSGGSNEDPEQLHIRHVLAVATEYTLANKRAPTSIDQLQKWAIKEGKASEEDFISTRDKKQYGFSSGGMGGLQIYEQSGKGGKVYISMQGGIAEMTQEQANNMAKQLGGAAPKGGPPGMK